MSNLPACADSLHLHRKVKVPASKADLLVNISVFFLPASGVENGECNLWVFQHWVYRGPTPYAALFAVWLDCNADVTL